MAERQPRVDNVTSDTCINITNVTSCLRQSRVGNMDRTSQEHGIDIDLINTPAVDAFRFNDKEQTILKLWDQEEEIRLELNLLRSQNSGKNTHKSTLSMRAF